MHSYHREAIRPPCKCHQKFGFAPLKKTVEAEQQLHWKRKTTMTRVKMYKKRKALLLQKAGE